MREVDRLMVEEACVLLLQMMENAGRCLALQARAMLGGDAQGRLVQVIAGRGDNGGGGLAAARRLSIWGAEGGSPGIRPGLPGGSTGASAQVA